MQHLPIRGRSVVVVRPSTVNELCDRAEAWAHTYYRKNGKHTGEFWAVRCALKGLRACAGSMDPDDLKAETVYEVQQWFIGRGLARKTVNSYVKRIRSILRWAA